MVARILDHFVPRMRKNPTVSEVDALHEQAKNYKKKYEREHKINEKLIDGITHLAKITNTCPKCDKPIAKILKALAVDVANVK
jgi:cobalamin biosynthesis Mg chelatase CobN